MSLLDAVQGIDGVEVETLLGDMAYSDGDVPEAVEEGGAQLVAKVPPVTNSGRFPKTDFAIDTAAGTVTCPAGLTTTAAKKAEDDKGRPGLRFSFPAATCPTCPLREQCVGGTKGRSIFVGRHDRIAAARVAQAEASPKALLRRRSKIERKIDHLQDLGMRKARYRGRRKTGLQALLAATVANFERLGVLGVLTYRPPSPSPPEQGRSRPFRRRCRLYEPSVGPTRFLIGPARPLRWLGSFLAVSEHQGRASSQEATSCRLT